MKIRGQIIIRNGDNYFIRIKEAYYGAYQRYSWENGVAGIGISSEMVNKAIKDNCGIVVNITKYGVYRINPIILEKYHNQNYLYQASDKKYLYEYPLNELELIIKSEEEKRQEEIKEVKRDISIQQALI